MKSRLTLSICCLTFFMTGCLHPTIGPKSIPQDRAAFGISIGESWQEQMLLNIVKMRYIDTPVFVGVGSIVMSYTLTENATAAGAINPWNTNSGAALGLSGTFANTPTITYTPMSGSAFIQGLLTPLPAESVFRAIQNGAPADNIMLSSVFSINGLKNQQATLDGITPADPAFDQVRKLLRRIQLTGEVRTYVRKDATGTAPVLALRKSGIAPETLADIQELRRLLKLNPDAEEFTLVHGAVSSSDTEIAILTRSVIGVMQNMAADVQVPAEDLAKHYAFPGYESERGVPDTARMIRIDSGKEKSPEAFVAVNYHDNWFWIDKGDLHSKQVFGQLLNLFTVADTSTPTAAPVVVTIPSR